jgi:hypothetical protein
MLRPLVESLRGALEDAPDRFDPAAAFDRLVVEVGVGAQRIRHQTSLPPAGAALFRQRRLPIIALDGAGQTYTAAGWQ